MSGFSSSSTGDFDKAFMTTTELLDKYVAGNLWVYGNNSYGQLGDNSTSNKSSPVQTVAKGSNWSSASCGWNTTTAIKTDGTLWIWGENSVGTVGDNSTINKSSPVQTVCGGNNWKQSASAISTFAIKTDGTLWSWGHNGNGQLGDNSVIHKSSPVQTIAGGNNWKQVSTSEYRMAAIKTDGTLWVCGTNASGQLGDNSTSHRSSPVQTVAGGTNWKSVSCGWYYIAAIKTDGTLWSWGINTNGQLGDNTIINRSSPVQTICGGTNWRQVSLGDWNCAAIKTDGTLWNWGNNQTGGLGDNTLHHRSSPIQTICGGNNWKQVLSINADGHCAIKTDGTLWSWGPNGYGQLSDNTIIHRSSPVQTVAGGNKWKSVSGFSSILALQFSNSIGVE